MPSPKPLVKQPLRNMEAAKAVKLRTKREVGKTELKRRSESSGEKRILDIAKTKNLDYALQIKNLVELIYLRNPSLDQKRATEILARSLANSISQSGITRIELFEYLNVLNNLFLKGRYVPSSGLGKVILAYWPVGKK